MRIDRQRGDTLSYRRHMLTHVEVETLDKGWVDLPVADRPHLIDAVEGPCS